MTRAAHAPASAVLMIRPAQFARNAETVATNRFQASAAGDAAAAGAARREFDTLVANLEQHGVRVHVFEGNPTRALPDEVFSNNWISTHADGTVVLYPMQAENRRRERRDDVVAWLERGSGYAVSRVLDLSSLEAEGTYLEGTGSAVIDHVNGTAYCGRSSRTCEAGIAVLMEALDLEPVVFTTADRNGHAVYHTNVLLAIGPTFVVACLEAIAAPDRERVAASLAGTGRELVPITQAQMHDFAANLLALSSPEGPVLALSIRAWNAFTAAQRGRLEQHGTIAPTDIATIERLGGGSVRCMLTELLLPPAAG